MWGGWIVVAEGPGTPWEDCDAGVEDPEQLEGVDDDEYEDL